MESNSFPVDKQEFPKLMTSREIVILATRKINEYVYSGFIVHSKNAKHTVGTFSDHWSVIAFEEYYGTIELKN